MATATIQSRCDIFGKRRGPARKPFRKPLYSSAFAGEIGWTENLSSWGAKVQTPAALRPGAIIEICLELYPGHLGIQARALVRWHHPEKRTAGLEFLGMSARSKRELEALVKG